MFQARYSVIIRMQKPTDLIPALIEGIQDKKGKKITILDLSEIESASADKFIICESGNPVQVSAIADSLQDKALEICGRKPSNVDGYRNAQWIVVDYGEVVVHVFLRDERGRYDLEGLWNDASITEIPDLD